MVTTTTNQLPNTRVDLSRQIGIEKRQKNEEKEEERQYVAAVIATLYEKKMANGGKVPHQETQATINKLERQNIVMNRCQVQYWLRQFEAKRATERPYVILVANNGTGISPLGMHGVEDQVPNVSPPGHTTSITSTVTNSSSSRPTKSSTGRPKGTTNKDL